MAIFCLANSVEDLKQRLGNIVVGYTREHQPVRAHEIKAHGAMTVLLKDALKPNLAQTRRGDRSQGRRGAGAHRGGQDR